MIDSNFYNDNFFVISSDDLNVSNRLYGFVLLGDKIIINSDKLSGVVPYDSYGSYVYVINDGDEVAIQQDWFGTYGLYLYRDLEYFAISNSFLFLINYLSLKRKLSFDLEYVKSYIGNPQASLLFDDTMISQISILPKNTIVKINKKAKTIIYEFYEQEIGTIDIDSFEAIEIIDKWHAKWNAVIRQLIETDYNVQFSLSGGKDSRIVFSCMTHPLLNFEKLPIYSAKDSLYTHKDDYAISELIADKYGFKLNEKSKYEKFYYMDPEENLFSSLLVKCGFHKEIMCSRVWHENMKFSITGAGGDLRDLWNEPVDSFVEKISSWSAYNTVDASEAIKAKMKNTVKKIKDLGYKNCITANDYFYKHGRQRNHNGKATVEFFLSNSIQIMPLMDPSLYRINQFIPENDDGDLLYSVIIHRYIDDIENIGFDGHRDIDSRTRILAKKISDKYELHEETFSDNDLMIEANRISPYHPDANYFGDECYKLYKKLFLSDSVRRFSLDFFGEEVYRKACIYWENRDYHPYIAASGIIHAFLVFELINFGKISLIDPLYYNSDVNDRKPLLYHNNGIVREIFDCLQSGRLDIKNFGNNDNEIVVLSSNANVYIETPGWFKDDRGSGKVFQTSNCDLQLRLKCIGNGELSVLFKGPWIKDSSGKPIIVKIDLTNLIILDVDNNSVLYQMNKNRTIDSINREDIRFSVNDGQTICIHATWMPHVYSSDEFADLYGQLLSVSKREFLFWKNY